MLQKDWTITDEASRAMEIYRWPGNVRQLKNAIERAQILANEHVITIDDLPAEVYDSHEQAGSESVQLGSGTPANSAERPNHVAVPGSPRLEDLEKAHIVEILRQQNGNKARTARILGIHRRKLYRLLERYGIADERPV